MLGGRRRQSAQDYEPVVGGGSFNAAPILEPGRYRDTLLPTEYLYYAFRLEPGQRLHVTANGDMPIQDFQQLGLSDITANLHSPTRSRYGVSTDFDVRGNFRVEGDPPLDITGPTVTAEEDTRELRPLVRAGRRLPRVLRDLHRGMRRAAEGRGPVPLRGRGPGHRAVDADAEPVGDAHAVADRHARRACGRRPKTESKPAVAAGFGVGGLLVGVVGGIVLRRRRG